MSRRLLPALVRSLRRAHAHGLDRDGPSRREVLASAGAAALSAVMPLGLTSCEDRPPREEHHRVAIVGAGIAGVHCAYRLRGSGVRATVYEASSRLGGRIATARDLQLGDQLVELGAEFISSGHRTMWALADELGIVLDDLAADAPSIHEVFFVRGRRVDERTLSEQLLEVWPAVEEEVAANLDVAPEARTLDRMSVADWLDEHLPESRSPELRAVLASAYRSSLGLELDEQSALNLVFLLATDDVEPFWIYGSLDRRFHCHDGNDTFVTRMAAHLPGQIETDACLEALRRRADGSLRLSFRRPEGGGFEATADHVVLALPFSTLREVELPADLDPDKHTVIDELGYGTNAKVVGSFSGRVWQDQYDASGSTTTDLSSQQFWDASIGQGGVLGEITSLLGGAPAREVARVSAEEWLCGVMLPDLEMIYPGTRACYLPGSALGVCWLESPYARGSYSCYRPGQWRLEGLAGLRDGRVHFCGEHCSLRFQSWMEGGAETSAVVAAEVLDDLGLRMPPLHEALLARILVEPHPCYHAGTRLRTDR